MNNNGNQFYEFEDFRLDAVQGVLFRGQSVVNLTPKAVEILRLLVERSGKVVTKEEIFAKVWSESFVEEANLSHHIFKLRKALGESEERKIIETVPKRGYRFVADLKTSNAPLDAVAGGSRKINWKIAVVAMLVIAAAVAGWFAFSKKPPVDPPAAPSKLRSIAVLPFANESGDEEIEYLADGLTESLISRFSAISSLRVRPHSAVVRYKGTALESEAVGKELNVGFLLCGRVTKRGNAVRLFLSLIDVESGYQTWGKQYERNVDSLALLQADIFKDVSAYLPAKLSGSDQERIIAATTRNSEAYILYLRGRYQLNRKTLDGLKKAIEHFNEAVAIDPAYALAHSGVADAYNQMGLWVTMPPAETFPRARAAAEHALSLDPELAEAHTALAWSKFYYYWDFAGAENDYQQAIGLNPDYTFARESYAVLIYETNPKRLDQAMKELKTAGEVDPLSLSLYFWRGAFYYFEGDNDQALRELEEAQNIDPNFTLGLALKGAAYREKGLYKEYLDHWLHASPLEGVDLSDSDIDRLRRIYNTGGLKSHEIAYAELLQQKSTEKYVSPVFVAMHYSIAGETELAFEWLEKAFAERSSWLVELKVDPAWKNLRSDARFQNLLMRIGFPE